MIELMKIKKRDIENERKSEFTCFLTISYQSGLS